MSTEDNPIGNPSKAKIANKVPTNEEILKLIQQLNAFFTSSTGKCPKFLQSSWEELRDYVNKNETPRRASAQVLEQTQKLLEVFSNDNSTQTEKLGALEAYKEALLRNKTNRRLWKASKILLRIGIGILILASAALLLTTVATLVLASGPVLPALLALTLGLAAKFSVLASIIMLATGLPLIAALILKINDTFAIIPGALANASEKVAKAAIAHIQDLSVKVDPTNIDEQEVAPKLLQIFFAAQATSETPILKLKKGQIYGKPGHQFKLTHAVMIVPPKGVGDQWRYLVIANDAKTKNKNNPSETSAKQFYKKRRILGKGAFGKVYQVAGEISLENEAATYKEFKKGRKLAIKKQAFANEEELEDIVREDGILAQLPRLGFIGSWDIKTKKNRKNRWEERYHTQHYGASNKLSGRTLEDVLKLNLDTDQIIALALLLLEQLPKQVHKNRIIHHDIKPENVMVKLEKDGAPREALYFDMGLARFKGEKHVPGGTPNYVAPEIALSLNQEEKTAEATATADLFAVKLMILQLFKAKLLPFLKHKDKSVNFEDRARGSCPINNSTLFENINDLTDSHKKIIIDSFLNEVMYNPSLPRWEKNIKPMKLIKSFFRLFSKSKRNLKHLF
jgi:serine/threonine protein kinase